MVVQLVVGAPPAKRRYVWRQRKQPWKGGNWCDLVGLPKVPDIGREGWQSGSWRRITRQTVDVWRKLVSYKFDEGSEPARWFLLRLMWFISWWHERLLKGRKMHRDHSWMGSNPLIEYGSTDCWPKKNNLRNVSDPKNPQPWSITSPGTAPTLDAKRQESTGDEDRR